MQKRLGEMETDGLIQRVEEYYTKTATKFGATPKGVDWNGEESQNLRFDVLTQITNLHDSFFSINDLGCGYGSFLEYCESKNYDFDYLGIDVSEKMIELAESKNFDSKRYKFLYGSEPNRIADYTFSSGIFNVKLDIDEEDWLEYILESITLMNNYSVHGFAFNCLSSIVESQHRRDYLYYSDAKFVKEFCLENISNDVSVMTNYGLYEFTVHVRKST
jgi:SAM-dependent methyltransferase